MLNQKILEHFQNPHNAGNLDQPTAVVEVSNPVCGDTMRLSVRLEAGQVVEARFKTQGCVASIAAGSVITDMLLGRRIHDAEGITAEQISDALGGLPPATNHAAQLAIDALKAVLKQIPAGETGSVTNSPKRRT